MHRNPWEKSVRLCLLDDNSDSHLPADSTEGKEDTPEDHQSVLRDGLPDREIVFFFSSKPGLFELGGHIFNRRVGHLVMVVDEDFFHVGFRGGEQIRAVGAEDGGGLPGQN